MRKELSLEYTDKIKVSIKGDQDIEMAIKEHLLKILSDVQGESIEFVDLTDARNWDIDGKNITIKISKIG